MSYDYGNARVAAMRGRLLEASDLSRLADAPDAFAFLAALERSDDWRPILHAVAPLGIEPAAAAEAAIERHRGERLGTLNMLYDGASRSLVEALVMGLDQERILGLLRRKRGAESIEAIGATIVRGALLDVEALGRIARASGSREAIHELAAVGLVGPDDVDPLVTAGDDRSRPEAFESLLVAACDRARDRRARGRGPDPALVRWALARERSDRVAVIEELDANGALAASIVERALTLDRFAELARRGRGETLGVGTPMGYVAAVESQAIRLRAALARVRAGWSAEALGRFLGLPGGRRWAVSSS